MNFLKHVPSEEDNAPICFTKLLYLLLMDLRGHLHLEIHRHVFQAFKSYAPKIMNIPREETKCCGKGFYLKRAIICLQNRC
jgi:hypothetical protein